MNLSIESWRSNDFSRVKERFRDIRMCTFAQGQELGWTPQEAFKDYTPTKEEEGEIESILPPSVNANKKRKWEEHKFTCLQAKCARRAFFGYETEDVPRFCDWHKYEGMVELGTWKPSFNKQEACMPWHAPSKRAIAPGVRSTPQEVKTTAPPTTAATTQHANAMEYGSTQNIESDFEVSPKKGMGKGKGKAKAKAASKNSQEGSIFQFLSPSSQQKCPAPIVKQEEPVPLTPQQIEYPPLLHPSLCPDEINAYTLNFVKSLWEQQTDICEVDGASFGVNELSSLLHTRGAMSYMNDNIMDALGYLMNVQQGDFGYFSCCFTQSMKRVSCWTDGFLGP